MIGQAEDANRNGQQAAFSPLLQAIVRRSRLPVAGVGDVEAFLADHEEAVLFFPGGAARIAESDDAAVILPELLKARAGLAGAVVSRDAERALQLRYRFNAFPALVFFRRGGYLGAIVRMRGWTEYLGEMERILALQPSEPPPFAFADRAGAARSNKGEADER